MGTSTSYPLLPMGGVTMDVGVWLRRLGLSRYEAAFRENAIDAEVLPDLTDGDLAQLGVNWEIASACSRRSRVWGRGAGAKPTSPRARILVDGRCRAPTDHGDVLRSRRLDESRREARRGRLAQPGQRLSRRSLGGGDRSRRPCAEEARRRADGAVRLSARAGERRRARACAPRSPSSARLPTSTPETPRGARRS